MKNLNNASLPLNFAGGKYSTQSVRLPNGQYIIKIVATGPCIGKVLKGNEVLTEVDFSSYKLLSYNDLNISFILSSESDIYLEITPKREDIKVYSASLYSSLLPIGKGGEPSLPLAIKSIGINSIKYAPGATAKIHPTSLGTNYGDFDYIFEVEFNQPINETTVSAEDFKYNNTQVESISFGTSTSVNFKISNLSTNDTLKYKDNVILLCQIEMPAILAWKWGDSDSTSLYFKQDQSITQSNPITGDTEPLGTFMYCRERWDGIYELLEDSTLKWRLQKGGTDYYAGVYMVRKYSNILYLETVGAFAVTPEKDDLIALEFNGHSLGQWLYV